MRVLLVTNRLDVSGADMIAVRLAAALTERGHRVLVASEGGPLEREVARSGAAFRKAHLDGKSPASLRAATRSIAEAIDEFRPEVLHCDAVTTALAGRLALRSVGSRIPLIVTIHNLEHRWLYPPAGPILRAVADALLTAAASEADSLARWGAPRATVLPNGVPLGPFLSAPTRRAAREALGIPAEAPMVLQVGRLSREKGQEYLLRAVPSVRAALPEARFYFVGGGADRARLEALRDALGLSETAAFAGERFDAPLWFAACDVAVLPSEREGMPVALIEAMAAARPVVASAVGGVPEVLEHDRTGLLCPPREPEPLARAIAGLLRSPAEAERMGREARRVALERFDFARHVDGVLRVYQERLDEKDGGERRVLEPFSEEKGSRTLFHSAEEVR